MRLARFVPSRERRCWGASKLLEEAIQLAQIVDYIAFLRA